MDDKEYVVKVDEEAKPLEPGVYIVFKDGPLVGTVSVDNNTADELATLLPLSWETRFRLHSAIEKFGHVLHDKRLEK